MEILVGLIISLFGAMGLAADETYYVCTEAGGDYCAVGSDNTGDGSLARPWATIGKAINSQTVKAGETCTIIVKDGDTLAADRLWFDNVDNKHEQKNFIIRSRGDGYFTQTPGCTYGIIAFTGVTTGSVTISNMVLTGDANCDVIVYAAPGKGMNLTLIDCSFSITKTAGGAHVFRYAANPNAVSSRNITLDNSLIQYSSYGLSITDADTIILTNGTTLKGTRGGAYGTYFDGVIGGLFIDKTTMAGCSGDGSVSLYSQGEAVIHKVKIRDSDITGGDVAIHLKDNIHNLLISGCTITGGAIDDESVALYLGEETPRLVENGFGKCEIMHNTITSGTGSAVRLYFGCNNVDFGFNQTRTGGTPHSFVIYSFNNSIHHNYLQGTLALFEASGGNNHIFNNTIYSVGSAYLTGIPSGGLGAYSTWLYPTNSDVYNNIIVSTSALVYAFSDYEAGSNGGGVHRGTNGDDEMSHYMDYNCYWNPNANHIISLGYFKNVVNTLPQLWEAWATGASDGTPWDIMMHEINDRHSIIGNPMFVDAEHGDFRLLPGSPCFTAGLGGAIGAWQPNPSNLLGDINNDQIVDFCDLAILSSQWLTESE